MHHPENVVDIIPGKNAVFFCFQEHVGQLADQLVCLQQVHIQHLLRIRVKIPHMLPLSAHHILIPDAAVLAASFSPVKRFVRAVYALLDSLLILVCV